LKQKDVPKFDDDVDFEKEELKRLQQYDVKLKAFEEKGEDDIGASEWIPNFERQ